MPLIKQQIEVAELRVGMYVCELDRPWLETPFLMQGFLLESEKEIQIIAQYCRFVYVDIAYQAEPTELSSVAQSIAQSTTPFIRLVTPQNQQQEKPFARKTAINSVASLLENRKQRKYHDTVEWREEMVAARQAVDGLTKAISEVMDELNQGRALKIVKLKQAVTPLVNSIERNPDACIWLARLKNCDSYSYKHSVACSIWAVALGRELGLPPSDLKTLALGALLLDIGKLQLPPALLNKVGELSDAEHRSLRHHVAHSLRTLKQSPTINRDVWEMVAYHHERYDGSGYPRGLRGDQIPLFAKIAGIADSYDAMTSDRSYRRPVSPSAAIKELYHARDEKFDAILVEEFIQAVGIYPAGTLVLLSSGEVAIVVAEGRTRRLKPQVLLLLDKNKKPKDELEVINLLDAACPDTGKLIEIAQSLEPGAFGVDPEQIAYQPS